MLDYRLKHPNQHRNRQKLKRLQEAGTKVPFLEHAPELSPLWEPYFRGWERLSASRERADGGHLQPIQFREIEAFCRLVGFTDQIDIDNMMIAVAVLDPIYLADHEQKLRRANRQGGRGGKG